jgi:hypothetical protein
MVDAAGSLIDDSRTLPSGPVPIWAALPSEPSVRFSRTGLPQTAFTPLSFPCAVGSSTIGGLTHLLSAALANDRRSYVGRPRPAAGGQQSRSSADQKSTCRKPSADDRR